MGKLGSKMKPGIEKLKNLGWDKVLEGLAELRLHVTMEAFGGNIILCSRGHSVTIHECLAKRFTRSGHFITYSFLVTAEKKELKKFSKKGMLPT